MKMISLSLFDTSTCYISPISKTQRIFISILVWIGKEKKEKKEITYFFYLLE